MLHLFILYIIFYWQFYYIHFPRWILYTLQLLQYHIYIYYYYFKYCINCKTRGSICIMVDNQNILPIASVKKQNVKSAKNAGAQIIRSCICIKCHLYVLYFEMMLYRMHVSSNLTSARCILPSQNRMSSISKAAPNSVLSQRLKQGLSWKTH